MGRALLAREIPTTASAKILVLGLGNILFQDEGVGVRAVERLCESYPLPECVRCLDGGTLGLDLLTYFTADTRMLILDAVRAGLRPGSLVRLEGRQIPAALAQKMSMHQLGLQDLMAASILRGSLPQEIILLGMEPAQVDWGLELSPPAAEALPTFIRVAARVLGEWGIPL